MAMLPQHPNVVRYFGTVLQKPHCALVLELWCAPAREPEHHRTLVPRAAVRLYRTLSPAGEAAPCAPALLCWSSLCGTRVHVPLRALNEPETRLYHPALSMSGADGLPASGLTDHP